MFSSQTLSRTSFAALVVVAASLLAACAGPATRVTLLPDPDGKATAVVVTTKAGSTELAQPYASADVAKDGATTASQLTAEEVAKRNPELLSLAPARAVNFLLYFKSGGTELTDESRVEMEKVLAEATKRSGGEIVVVGHTDTVGSEESNDKVSQNRAIAIRDAIVAKGFPGDRIEAVGRGKREPLIKSGDNVDEPRNRRVEINVR